MFIYIKQDVRPRFYMIYRTIYIFPISDKVDGVVCTGSPMHTQRELVAFKILALAFLK